MSKCNCNVCRLPDDWKKALDKYSTIWGSAKDSSDMGVEFGLPNLVKFVNAVKDKLMPDIKLKNKPRLKEIAKIANKIATEEAA